MRVARNAGFALPMSNMHAKRMIPQWKRGVALPKPQYNADTRRSPGRGCVFFACRGCRTALSLTHPGRSDTSISHGLVPSAQGPRPRRTPEVSDRPVVIQTRVRRAMPAAPGDTFTPDTPRPVAHNPTPGRSDTNVSDGLVPHARGPRPCVRIGHVEHARETYDSPVEARSGSAQAPIQRRHTTQLGQGLRFFSRVAGAGRPCR